MSTKKEALLVSMNVYGIGSVLDIRGELLIEAILNPSEEVDWELPPIPSDWKQPLYIYEVVNPRYDAEKNYFEINHGEWRPLTEEEWLSIRKEGTQYILERIENVPLDEKPDTLSTAILYLYPSEEDEISISIGEEEDLEEELQDLNPLWSWNISKSQDIN